MTLGNMRSLGVRGLKVLRIIWFTVWSSVVHGAIMAWQGFSDAAERGHLLGDVPALFLIAIVLGVLMQMGSSDRVMTASWRPCDKRRAPYHLCLCRSSIRWPGVSLLRWLGPVAT
jgi:hypothetical protein